MSRCEVATSQNIYVANAGDLSVGSKPSQNKQEIK